jgi:hypothetical protein
MPSHLWIDGDPTPWELSQPPEVSELARSAGPLQLAVSHPAPGGIMLLSIRAAASVVLSSPPAGIIPSDITSPEPFLYLPSPAGMSGDAPGYRLPPSTDLAALARHIMSAMAGRTVITVGTIGHEQGDAIVLNGATLPFAVLCPAS